MSNVRDKVRRLERHAGQESLDIEWQAILNWRDALMFNFARQLAGDDEIELPSIRLPAVNGGLLEAYRQRVIEQIERQADNEKDNG
jgi:hypothetical protein